jgi:hypothetical protein
MNHDNHKRYLETNMDSAFSSRKKNVGFGIDYVGDGVYTILMIRGNEFVPIRSSEDPIELFQFCESKTERTKICISESVRIIIDGSNDSPSVKDIANFILE